MTRPHGPGAEAPVPSPGPGDRNGSGTHEQTHAACNSAQQAGPEGSGSLRCAGNGTTRAGEALSPLIKGDGLRAAPGGRRACSPVPAALGAPSSDVCGARTGDRGPAETHDGGRPYLRPQPRPSRRRPAPPSPRRPDSRRRGPLRLGIPAVGQGRSVCNNFKDISQMFI